MIVGVSDEGAKLIGKYVKDFEVKYPMVDAPAAMRAFGVNAYPTYFLIDPDGEIVGTSHPDEATIQAELKKVSLAPPLPAGAKFGVLQRAWQGGQLEAVQQHLDRLLADTTLTDAERTQLQQAKTGFDRDLKGATEEVPTLGTGPDYLTGQKRLQKLVKRFGKLAPGLRAQEELDRFAKDEKIQTEIKAGKALAQIRAQYDWGKTSDRRKGTEALRAFVKKNRGTHAAFTAEKLLAGM